jgi:uncharacterized hydrophobic protein (TIGR00271 family)
MSVVFLVRSEEELRSGAPWCTVFAEAMDSPIVPVVLGADRKVLEKHAESVLEKRFRRQNNGKTDVQTVDPSTDEVLELCRTVRCRLLVIMHSVDQDDWQKELFETSTFRTVWLCPAAEPPADESHLIGGFLSSESITSRLSMKLMGMRPGTWSVERLPPEDMDRNQQLSVVREMFDAQSLNPESLIILPIESIAKESLTYSVSLKLLDHDFGTSVALIREGESILPGIISAFRRWTDSITPPLTRSERITLQEDLESGSKPSLEFLGLISAASMLAAFGLLQNSAAVIIGAMLIAPLMTPILGAGLAITLGNRPLFKTALTAIVLGFIGAFVSSALFGLLVRAFESPDLTPARATELWARCNPSPIDFCVGFIGGMAAAYGRTRTHLSSALAGAAIAAALVPPISAAGLQFVFGVWTPVEEGIPVLGPLLVVSINVVTIMVASSLVLWLRGIRARSGEWRTQDRWAVRVVVILVAVILLVLVGMLGGVEIGNWE